MRRKINRFMSLLALAACLVTFAATLTVSYQTALNRMETETFRQASLVAAGLEEIQGMPSRRCCSSLSPCACCRYGWRAA